MPEQNGPEAWRQRYVHPCDWTADFPPLAVTEMLAESVRRHPDRVLVDFMGREFTYEAIEADARRFAAGLQAMGIVKGDRVGIYLPNVPIFVSAYYGAMMAGAVVVSFSTMSPGEEFLTQVADSGARILVTIDDARLLENAEETLKEGMVERLVVARFASLLPFWLSVRLRLFHRRFAAAVRGRPGVVEWSEALADGPLVPVAIDPLLDAAMLQYTGGTTGAPIAAILSHQNIASAARQFVAVEPHSHARHVIVGTLPLFHIFGNICVLNAAVSGGGTIAMLPHFRAGQVLATIERTKATTMPGVPAMFRALLDYPTLEKHDLSSLFTCISGGAPMLAELKRSFEKATGAKLVEGYGLTEAAGVVAANPFDGREKAGTVGHPLPATHLRLLDREDPARDAVAGEAGELAVSGPQVMLGYWHVEPGNQPFVEHEGKRWLRTGDIASIDEDGYVSLIDRVDDIIAVDGSRVSPARVEQKFSSHPEVRDVMVVGKTGDDGRLTLRGFVVLEPSSKASEVELLLWINDRVSRHDRIESIEVRTTLPRTALGKPDRKEL
jgi:Acyl-CoA synthetases (AMP-forming)/AMP-acid ligases II